MPLRSRSTPPLVFCAVCAYLFYSSVTYAASRNAVHVSLLVMAAGVVALVVTGGRHRRSVRTAQGGALSND